MRGWFSLVAVLLALLTVPSPAAMEAAPGALAEGGTLPAFRLPSASGGEVSLDQLTADGPAVLVVYRGVW